MLYEMATQLATGKAGEDVIVRTFSPIFEIEESTRNDQRQGIDFWFTNRKTRHRTSVEVKTDWMAEKTGNAFVETVSVQKDGAEALAKGWIYTSKADRLIYLLPASGIAHVFRFEALRKMLPGWIEAYPSRKAKNPGYTGAGILVPLSEFTRYSNKYTAERIEQERSCRICKNFQGNECKLSNTGIPEDADFGADGCCDFFPRYS